MYLPFLIALLAVISMICGKKKIGYVCWSALLIVTLGWFSRLATNPLYLSF
ncbi:DUF5993 family protein [Glaciimonas sp. GG7]